MVDRDPRIGAIKFLTCGGQLILLADQNDPDTQFLRGLHRAFNDRGRSVVSAHRIDGNLHVRLAVHG